MSVGSLLLCGCAVRAIDPGPASIPGRVAVRPGLPGIVVAAPHGSSDQYTADMVASIAERTGFASVIASGFTIAPADIASGVTIAPADIASGVTIEPDDPARAGRRYQVNRPFEGVPGRPASEDVATAEARAVYLTWERRVREAAEGPLAFYVEVHGNDRRDSAARIEIATVGIDHEQAVRLRTLFELIRDAHLRGEPGAVRLEVLVEPADALRYAASGAKRDGILRLPERALHIELPRVARLDGRAVYSAILAGFLREAVPLLQSR